MKLIKLYFYCLIFACNFSYAWDEASLEGKCPHGCGQRYMDYNIQKIQQLLCKHLSEFNNISLSHYGYGLYSNQKDSNYFLCNTQKKDNNGLKVFVEVDSSHEVGNYDPFNYEEWNNPYDIEINIWNKITNQKIFKEFALENYSHFIIFFTLLKSTIQQMADKNILKNNQTINSYNEIWKKCLQDEDYAFEIWYPKIYNYYSEFQAFPYFNYGKIKSYYFEKISNMNRNNDKIKKNLPLLFRKIDLAENELNLIYQSIFDKCISKHKLGESFYNRGLLNFHLGKNFEALNDIKNYIDKTKKISSQIYQLKGQLQSELGLYNNAIIALSEAIKYDPKNKEAYLERAHCYFETGDFDIAINDFINSKIKISSINPNDVNTLNFSKGLICGVMKGGKDGLIDFVPSTLSSVYGLANGLWAFTLNPLEFSQQMVDACKSCAKYIKENTSLEMISKLVPELQELISNWDKIDDLNKGQLIGYVIGKYGIDIFMTAGSLKAIKAYRNLKNANNILTFQTIALNKRNKALIKLESINRNKTRKEILKHSNLRIQWDKQGKHIINHKNYNENLYKSILTYPNPQELIKNFAGKGLKDSPKLPGKFGYKEVINFEKNIGFYLDLNTKEKIVTTYGKIHYAKDGVHIVPRKPY
jgi:hypothetical protein